MSKRQVSLDILWADENYVAISKPAGLAAIPGRAEKTSALELIAAQLNLPFAGAADPRIRVVHRIDKETSGVLLFAKNRTAQRHVSHQFQNNLVEKRYLALVAGVPSANQGEIDLPIARHPTSAIRMVISKQGRPAKTLWQLAEGFRDMALLQVFPKTGKTHQIRVHLQRAGMPLLIDPVYNPRGMSRLCLTDFKRHYQPTRKGEERPLISRLTLHAEFIKFMRLSGQMVEISGPLPRDFRSALNMLRKYAH